MLRGTYIDNEMIPQELYVVIFSAFFTLLMTWNKLLHLHFFSIGNIDYIFFNTGGEAVMLTEQTHSFCSYSLYLLIQANLLSE